MPITLRLRSAGSCVATVGRRARAPRSVPSGPLGLIRPTMVPQIAPLAASGHGPILHLRHARCGEPRAHHRPDCCAEAGRRPACRAQPPASMTSHVLFPPRQFGQDIGRQPAVDLAAFSERAPVERSNHAAAPTSAERSMCDTRYCTTPGAGMQLPVGELLQDDRAQQLVVGRRHGHRGRRAQPRGEIGQGDPPARRRQLGRPAADGRAARAPDCRDGTARARARARRGRSRARAIGLR